MTLRTYKPVTPGMRQLVKVDRSELFKGKPVKTLTEGLKSHGGRTTTGASPRAIRVAACAPLPSVDFRRRKYDIEGVVQIWNMIQPHWRSSRWSKYRDGQLSYISRRNVS